MQRYDLDGKFTDGLMAAFLALPSVAPDPEDQPELRQFYNEFVKPYFSLLAYHRTLAKHGVNMTQFGLTEPEDPAGTFKQTSDSRRSVLMKSTLSDSNVALTKLNKELGRINYTLDGVVYATAPITKPRLGISGIKRDTTPVDSYLKRFL